MGDDENGFRNDDGGEDTVVEILGFGDSDEVAGDQDKAAASGANAAADAEVALLETELAAERDRALRLRADFDNYRKRVDRERTEAARYMLAEPARELLPVVDNLERALAAGGGGDELRRGVEMILRQLEELLRRFGVTPVAALGQRFDPAVHEAVAHEESSEHEMPTVVAELQRGYRMGDRLLRPAMVKVAGPGEAEERPDTDDTP
jgi:molecular chaperone GrpE